MVRANCPSCNGVLLVPTSESRALAKCPECKHELLVLVRPAPERKLNDDPVLAVRRQVAR
jgi:uncharacterized paraquat-inducible protein A